MGGQRVEGLQLLDWSLFSKSESGTGTVSEAVYFIGACAIEADTGKLTGPVCDYKLIVMTDTAEDYLANNADPEAVLKPVYVVPSKKAPDGIIHYMHTTFFEPADPGVRDELVPFLIGPINDDSVL